MVIQNPLSEDRDMSKKVANETWANTVQTNFQIQYWPFIQSNQTRTCVNNVINESPENLFKLSAGKVGVVIGLTLGSFAV